MTALNPDAQLLRALRFEPERVAALENIVARVAGLRAAGYVIEESSGYQLISSPTALIADDLAACLPLTATIGRQIVVVAETNSTNDLAAQAGRDGVPEGAVFIAESQRAGRGRLDRQWDAPPGLGLLMSVLLRPSAPEERWHELTYCAALAVAETAERFVKNRASIKWPNDVLLNARKVSGILLERHATPSPFIVIGIGLNILQEIHHFSDGLKQKATSLKIEHPEGMLDRRKVAVTLLNQLERYYGQWSVDPESIQRAVDLRLPMAHPA